MTSATRRFNRDRRLQKAVHLRGRPSRENFGLDPMYVGPVVAHGFAFRTNHCRTYVLPWKRTFKNTASLKKFIGRASRKFVVDYAMPADCDR